MIEHELARVVLLERSIEANSPETRFRKEWKALRATEARAEAQPATAVLAIEAEDSPVDRFIKLDRAA